jgi:hypothetical protein
MKTSRSIAMPCAALLVLATTTAAAAPQVQENVVGPVRQGGTYVLSQSGGHVAYMGLKGTRVAVTVDGVAGPDMDELFTATGQSFYAPQQAAVMASMPGGQPNSQVPVIFSPDGAHYAYAARQGDQYVVIHDGKEVARGPRAALALSAYTLALSPNGKQVSFIETQNVGGRGQWRLVMSGRAGPWTGNSNGIKPAFNADETRYAYTAAPLTTGNQVLVVDGKEAGYAGFSPVFTADGKLLTIAPSPNAGILVDGRPAVTGLSVDKVIPSAVGNHWGTIVRTKLVNSMGVPEFFLDGKVVPGTEGAQNAWFSRDGQHYAVACENTAARSMYLVIDGRKQNEYQTVATDDHTFWWTADHSRFFYVVQSAGRQFLVTNGEELPINALIGYEPLVTPQSGARYGYGTRDGSSRVLSLVVDGKNVLPEGMRPYDNSLVFSPQGSHYGFFAGPVARNEMTTLVYDGAVREGVVPAYFANWVTSTLVSPSLVFSRDGAHVAYMGTTPGAKGPGVIVDGKLVAANTRKISFPTFTPDGAHFFWVAEEAAKIQGQPPSTVVYADGVEAVRANGYFFSAVAGTFTMDSAGAVTFFAADGDMAKRYRITAGSDTNVASLLRRGDELAAAGAAEKAAQEKAAADAAAQKQKSQADAAAAAAKAREDQAARVAAAQKARADAVAAQQKARQLQIENARRAKAGLPPLKQLPE